MTKRSNQTKFPVARIKKIMQKDEEVGKVAQATPVVISKALELFLGMLVAESAKVTMDRNAKRVESYHLKHAVECTDMLDFLREIVAGIPDPSAGGTIEVEAESHTRTRNRGGDPLDPSAPSSGRKRRASAPNAAGSTATGEKKRRPRKKTVAVKEEAPAQAIAEDEEMNYDNDNYDGDDGDTAENGDDDGEYGGRYNYPRESRSTTDRDRVPTSEADQDDDDAYSDRD